MTWEWNSMSVSLSLSLCVSYYITKFNHAAATPIAAATLTQPEL